MLGFQQKDERLVSNSHGCRKSHGNTGLKRPRIPCFHAGGRVFESLRYRHNYSYLRHFYY